MKKVFYILLSGLVALNLTSCLSGANWQEGSCEAVVGYNATEKLPSILTIGGEFAAPDLVSTDLEKGDCIYVKHFVLDYDHQPEKASVLYATNVSYFAVDQSPAQVQTDFDETAPLVLPNDDLLPIQGIMEFSYSPIFEGKLFLHFKHSAPSKQEMKYIAIVNSNSKDTIDVYLVAQKINHPESSNTTIENLYVIDMYDVIRALGKDASYKEGGTPEYRIKELKISIKYCTGLGEGDVPKYELFRYKDNSKDNSVIVLSVFI